MARGGHRRAYAAHQTMDLSCDHVRRHRCTLHHIRYDSSRIDDNHYSVREGLQESSVGARGNRARQEDYQEGLVLSDNRPASFVGRSRLLYLIEQYGPRREPGRDRGLMDMLFCA